MNNALLVRDIGSSYDAFSRLRTSNTYTLFDSKTLYDKNTLNWTEFIKSTGTTATSVFNENQSRVSLNVATVGDVVIRQTKQYFPYQPGKSQLVMMTGILGTSKSGIISRLGYFDNDNGLFFEMAEDGLHIVKRTSTSGAVVDERVHQSNWNKNKLLSSGDIYQFQPDKVQVFYFNFEWLGTGDIVFGVMIANQMIPLHHFYISNNLTTVSFSIPNLPSRYELRKTSTAVGNAELICVCTTILSEGGRELTGIHRIIDRGITKAITGTNDSIHPVIAFRIKPARKGTMVYLQGFDILISSVNKQFRWAIICNPTTITGRAFSFVDLDTDISSIQVDRTINNTLDGNNEKTTITGGVEHFGGYGDTKINNNITSSVLALKNSVGFSFTNEIDPDETSLTSEIFVLAVQSINSASLDIYATIELIESN